MQRDRTHYAEAALRKNYLGADPRVVLVSTSIQSELDDIQLVAQQDPDRGCPRAPASQSVWGSRPRRCTPGAFAASSARPTALHTGSSTSRSSTMARTSCTSWPRRSSTCVGGSRRWTTRGGRSSPTPRTSCVRRSSRWRAALELLEDENLDEPTREDFLETMRDQVERLTRLTADLLDLSRMDAGRMPVGR